MTDAIYKVYIMQEPAWSNWSNWAGPSPARDVAAYIIILRNTYGEGGYETDLIGSGNHLYVRSRHVVPNSYIYTGTVTKVQ